MPTPSPNPRILIADDEPLFLKTTGELLTKAGYECVCVADAGAALDALGRERFDLVLSDLNMPGNAQLELLREGRTQWPEVPLIVITGVPSLPTAIESLRLGIADYLLKPVGYRDLLSSIRRTLGTRAERPPGEPRGDDQRRELAQRFPEIVGDSPRMVELFDIIDRVAAHRHERSDHGGKRDGQGDRGPHDSSPQPPRRAAVSGPRLHDDSR